MQGAVVLVALGAQYLNRRGSDSDSFSGASSLVSAPFVAVGNAVGWVKAKITGKLALLYPETCNKPYPTYVEIQKSAPSSRVNGVYNMPG